MKRYLALTIAMLTMCPAAMAQIATEADWRDTDLIGETADVEILPITGPQKTAVGRYRYLEKIDCVLDTATGDVWALRTGKKVFSPPETATAESAKIESQYDAGDAPVLQGAIETLTDTPADGDGVTEQPSIEAIEPVDQPAFQSAGTVTLFTDDSRTAVSQEAGLTSAPPPATRQADRIKQLEQQVQELTEKLRRIRRATESDDIGY